MEYFEEKIARSEGVQNFRGFPSDLTISKLQMLENCPKETKNHDIFEGCPSEIRITESRLEDCPSELKTSESPLIDNCPSELRTAKLEPIGGCPDKTRTATELDMFESCPRPSELRTTEYPVIEDCPSELRTTKFEVIENSPSEFEITESENLSVCPDELETVKPELFGGDPCELKTTEPCTYRELIQYSYLLSDRHPGISEQELTWRLYDAVVAVWRRLHPSMVLRKDNVVKKKILHVLEIVEDLNQNIKDRRNKDVTANVDKIFDIGACRCSLMDGLSCSDRRVKCEETDCDRKDNHVACVCPLRYKVQIEDDRRRLLEYRLQGCERKKVQVEDDKLCLQEYQEYQPKEPKRKKYVKKAKPKYVIEDTIVEKASPLPKTTLPTVRQMIQAYLFTYNIEKDSLGGICRAVAKELVEIWGSVRPGVPLQPFRSVIVKMFRVIQVYKTALRGRVTGKKLHLFVAKKDTLFDITACKKEKATGADDNQGAVENAPASTVKTESDNDDDDDGEDMKTDLVPIIKMDPDQALQAELDHFFTTPPQPREMSVVNGIAVKRRLPRATHRSVKFKRTMDYYDDVVGMIDNRDDPSSAQFAAAALRELLLSRESYLDKTKIGMTSLLLHLSSRAESFSPLCRSFQQVEARVLEDGAGAWDQVDGLKKVQDYVYATVKEESNEINDEIVNLLLNSNDDDVQ